jgi:hypothetical protein
MANVPLIRDGSYGLPRHPFSIDGITSYGVAVNADLGALQTLVDSTLGATGSGIQFTVISPQVLFTFMRMACLRSDPDPNLGFYTETELNVSLLLAARSWKAPFPRLYWYMPYLWIDTPTPQLAGRDIFGYPKLRGNIRMPAGAGAPAEMIAEAEVLQPQSHSTCAHTRPIFAARRVDGGNPGPLEHGDLSIEPDTAAGVLLDKVVDLSLGFFGNVIAQKLLATVGLDHLLRLVFLRQLPSIEDDRLACYQSLAATNFSITQFRGAGLLEGKYEVEIPCNASLHLAENLGIGSGGGDVTVAAKAAYFMDFDMRLDRGTELWVAT